MIKQHCFPCGGKSSILFRIRVSFAKEPLHHLGFLNMLNTVSGNCLMSDLEQHAFLLPFSGNHFVPAWTLRFLPSRLDCIGSSLLVSKGFQPQWPVICPFTCLHADSLMSWHCRPRLPLNGLWGCNCSGEGMLSWTTVGYYKCEPAAYLLPQKNLVTVLRSSPFSPPCYCSLCSRLL